MVIHRNYFAAIFSLETARAEIPLPEDAPAGKPTVTTPASDSLSVLHGIRIALWTIVALLVLNQLK